jgi:hypothetical protein
MPMVAPGDLHVPDPDGDQSRKGRAESEWLNSTKHHQQGLAAQRGDQR